MPILGLPVFGVPCELLLSGPLVCVDVYCPIFFCGVCRSCVSNDSLLCRVLVMHRLSCVALLASFELLFLVEFCSCASLLVKSVLLRVVLSPPGSILGLLFLLSDAFTRSGPTDRSRSPFFLSARLWRVVCQLLPPALVRKTSQPVLVW